MFQLVTFPYVARVLHATNYGRVNFGNSILSYFLLLAQLGTTSYVIREGAGVRDDLSKIKKLADEVYTINFLATIISMGLYVLTIFLWERLQDKKAIMVVLGIQLVLNIFNVEWVNNIYEDFKYIAIRNSIIQVVSLTCILLFVKNENDFVIYALILGMAASLNYCVNFYHCRRTIKIGLTLQPNIKKHILPIVILFFNALAVSIYVNSDITILGILQNDSVVGIYSVSVKVYTVVKKIFQAVVIVSIPRLSNYLAKEEAENYKSLLKRMHDTVITIVFPLLIGLIIIAKNAILIVSGEEYLKGVESLQILSIALIFSSLANFYVSCVLLPNKKEKLILISTIVSSLVNVCLNFVLIPILSLNGAALTTVIAEVIVMLLSIHAAGEYKQIKGSVEIYLKIAIGCVGIIIACYVTNYFNFGLIFNTAIKIFGAGMVYFVIELVLRNPVLTGIVKRFRKSDIIN